MNPNALHVSAGTFVTIQSKYRSEIEAIQAAGVLEEHSEIFYLSAGEHLCKVHRFDAFGHALHRCGDSSPWAKSGYTFPWINLAEQDTGPEDALERLKIGTRQKLVARCRFILSNQRQCSKGIGRWCAICRKFRATMARCGSERRGANRLYKQRPWRLAKRIKWSLRAAPAALQDN